MQEGVSHRLRRRKREGGFSVQLEEKISPERKKREADLAHFKASKTSGAKRISLSAGLGKR